LTKEESQAEVDALKEQVANDEKFIDQTNAQLAAKKEEWKDRKELRYKEQEAFSKAIAILHSDDARDLFKRSFHSQGYMFLQEGLESATRARQQSAVEVIRQAGRQAKDGRLAVLATRLRAATGNHFTEVIKVIDEMIALLKDEENSDLEKKEECEKNRMEDTRTAVLKARSVDESSELIAKLSAEIAAL
jgi:hypothetical protein